MVWRAEGCCGGSGRFSQPVTGREKIMSTSPPFQPTNQRRRERNDQLIEVNVATYRGLGAVSAHPKGWSPKHTWTAPLFFLHFLTLRASSPPFFLLINPITNTSCRLSWVGTSSASGTAFDPYRPPPLLCIVACHARLPTGSGQPCPGPRPWLRRLWCSPPGHRFQLPP